MKKHSKRFQELAKLTDDKKTYTTEEAVEIIKKTSNTKFDSSVEIHINLGIDPKKGDQSVRSSLTLPHGTGKTKKIAVITSPEKEDTAKKAGADIVGGEEMIAEIKKTEKTNFDILLSTPDMMRKIAPIARTLGTRGLMPSPKNDTVVTDIVKAIEEIKKGKFTFKNDDTANIHGLVGKVSFENKKIIENITTFIEAVEKTKPSTTKGTYIKNISISSTMGPGIKILK